MSIVCLSELGSHGTTSAVVAALLANTFELPLHLAQSTGVEGQGDSALHRASVAWVGARLARKVERVRSLTEEIHSHVLDGPAERAVCMLAERQHAAVIVLGAGAPDSEQRGDLVAQHASVPVLLVRDEGVFIDWAARIRPLRVLAAVAGPEDLERLSPMVTQLTRKGRGEVTVVHLERSPGASDESVSALNSQLATSAGNAGWRVCVDARGGPLAERLIAIAAEQHSDLVVIGSRAMSRVSRLWQRSVSRRVLQQAQCSVLCVPIRRRKRRVG